MVAEMYETLSNRSFVSLCVAGVLAAMAAGMGASLSQYFLAFFWEFSTKDISMFMSSYYFAAFIALYAAVPFSRRLGKRRAWRWSAVVSVLVGIGPMLLRLAGLMPENHTTTLFVVIFAQTLATLAFAIMSVTFFSSMMADVVEDNELRTGRRSEGLLFSVSIFLNKAVSGLGIFSASILLGLIDFPSAAQHGQIDPALVRKLALVYAPTALCLYGLAIWAVRGYRITRSSHEKTLRELGGAPGSVAN
jgi:Na+/melibiose symporter-like transporter